MDPTGLHPGLHYGEVLALEVDARERGPLFRVPVTVIKPLQVGAVSGVVGGVRGTRGSEGGGAGPGRGVARAGSILVLVVSHVQMGGGRGHVRLAGAAHRGWG